jgi:RNA polymerase sigma factor (TIGR02999 family)
LRAVRLAEPGAVDELMTIVYGELRRRARECMRRERAGHTIQPTALVHEVYLRLVGQNSIEWQDRAHFFRVAATSMRRILIDHARRRASRKRMGAAMQVTLDEAILPAPSQQDPAVLLDLDEAMTRFAGIAPRASEVVHLFFFGGLTAGEIAETLDISTKTVMRDLKVARAWLHGELSRRSGG